MVTDNVKNFIFDYCRYLHLAQMPDTVSARFKEYENNKDFAGNMKDWPQILQSIKANNWPELTDDKLEDLYALFQDVFVNMAQDADHREFSGKPKKFFDKWYGTNKLFEEPTISDAASKRLNHFIKNILIQYKGFFRTNLKQYLPADMEYDDFIKNLQDPVKQKEAKIRKSLGYIIEYTQTYSAPEYASYNAWPAGAPQYDFTQDMSPEAPAVNPDVNKWFEHTYNPAFKYRLPELFGTLLSDKKTFEYFQSKDAKGVISKNVADAIAKTNYADDKSDDYVPEKDSDQKTAFQRLNDKLNKIKENQLDPWTKILRGNRRFFSPYAKLVIEACSNVTIKEKDGKSRKLSPTDGLQGLLSNANTITNKIQDSPTARDHWKWISGKLKIYSDKYPKAFDGALRNPYQMKKIVSKFIIDAVNEGKVEHAETALEMISTLKYGIAHSRTVDAQKKEDFTVLSAKGLSWNNYEAMRFFTGAMDATAKFALLGVGRGIAAIHNKWMRDNTKFRGKDGFMASAHDLWRKNNNKNEYETNVRGKIEADLKQEKDRLNDAGDDIITMATESSKPTPALNDAIAKLQTKLATLKSEKSDKEQELQQYEDKLNHIKRILGSDPDAKRTEIKNGINTLNTEKTKLEADIKSKNKEANQIEAEIKIWDGKMKAMKPDDPAFAGVAGYKTSLENKLAMLQSAINGMQSDIYNKQAELDKQKNLQNTLSKNALNYLNNNISDTQTDIDNLDLQISNNQKPLDEYNRANSAVKVLTNQLNNTTEVVNGWDEAHKDDYVRLMAHWDKLETYWKSHQLTFAADKMRKNFLSGYKDGNSKAQQLSAEFLDNYKKRYNL